MLTINFEPLVLEDLAEFAGSDQIQDLIRWDAESEFETGAGHLNDVEFLIAYKSVGNWGCDSSAFYLARRGNDVFEVHGSHCSCYGFEGQWDEEEIPSAEALLARAERWYGLGGYDNNPDGNSEAIKERMRFLAPYLFQ